MSLLLLSVYACTARPVRLQLPRILVLSEWSSRPYLQARHDVREHLRDTGEREGKQENVIRETQVSHREFLGEAYLQAKPVSFLFGLNISRHVLSST